MMPDTSPTSTLLTFALPKVFGAHSVTRCWIPRSSADRPTSRPGVVLAECRNAVRKIVIGDTGRPGLTARDAAFDLGQAYGHLLVDDTEIMECVPALTSSVGLVEQARYVAARSGQSFDAQATAIAINLCFGGVIDARKVMDRCTGLLAFLCKRFDIDPEQGVTRAADLDPARKDPDQVLAAANVDFKQLLMETAALVKSMPDAAPDQA